jgi:hypothetical protein
MDSQAAKGQPRIRDKLMADHRRLDTLLEETLLAIEAGDRESIANSFTELDCGLRTHLEAEEQHLIPSLLRTDPRAARAIMAEHRHIRSRLLELASAIDLHTIRFSQANTFAGELRAHARNEDTLLYQWADEHLGEAEKNSLLAALVDKVMSRIRASGRASTVSAGLGK